VNRSTTIARLVRRMWSGLMWSGLVPALALTLAAVAGTAWAPAAHAQLLDETCTANILNRSVKVSPDGTFALPSVPVEPGLFRVRVVCEDADGTTLRGQSSFISLQGPGPIDVSDVRLGVFDQQPASLAIVAPTTVLSAAGETVQLEAVGTLPDGTARDLSTLDRGTTWSSSNANLASITDSGLLTAHRRGRVIVTARNEGVLASQVFELRVPEDADGDGLPDDYEIGVGLDPADPTDASSDRDRRRRMPLRVAFPLLPLLPCVLIRSTPLVGHAPGRVTAGPPLRRSHGVRPVEGPDS